MLENLVNLTNGDEVTVLIIGRPSTGKSTIADFVNMLKHRRNAEVKDVELYDDDPAHKATDLGMQSDEVDRRLASLPNLKVTIRTVQIEPDGSLIPVIPLGLTDEEREKYKKAAHDCPRCGRPLSNITINGDDHNPRIKNGVGDFYSECENCGLGFVDTYRIEDVMVGPLDQIVQKKKEAMAADEEEDEEEGE